MIRTIVDAVLIVVGTLATAAGGAYAGFVISGHEWLFLPVPVLVMLAGYAMIVYGFAPHKEKNR